jgi:hypothetical protein
MTELDYLDKHPFDFVVAGDDARIRVMRCPKGEGCGDHPILVVNQPADSPGIGRFVPFNDVDGALIALLRTTLEGAIVPAKDEWLLVEAVVAYRKDLTDVVRASIRFN